MPGLKHRLTSLFMTSLPSEGAIGPSEATSRLSYRGFERRVHEAADTLGLGYHAEVESGLVTTEIVITVSGAEDQVRQFARYAFGLSAASNTGGAGGGP